LDAKLVPSTRKNKKKGLMGISYHAAELIKRKMILTLLLHRHTGVLVQVVTHRYQIFGVIGLFKCM
jgi:hypothetical protein